MRNMPGATLAIMSIFYWRLLPRPFPKYPLVTTNAFDCINIMFGIKLNLFQCRMQVRRLKMRARSNEAT